MNNQSFEEIMQDQYWSNGFDACMRNKVKPAKQHVEYVLNILLTAGTSEDDDTIIYLKKAIKLLK